MNGPFSHERVNELLSLCAAIETRFAELLLKSKPQKTGFFGFLERLLTPKRTSSNQPVWRQETEDIIRALADDDKQQLASLLNLRALNAAIEAARYQDAVLAQHAEALRRFSQEARSFTSEE
ncbi:hypothetical protein KLP40_00210 [Hymenobacter sp. NST-14]|uniref:hypothetical protein n=1 Tax=Hymenobacter piscis TaxID=2839984 RepID=UPI001C010F61|nr:hypothetical protein [Hymenobacter piscis]MBT9391566.1 hypothetical protein [Hymenobacter piscis]